MAKGRIQSILDRDTVACQKTLEQKIGDQGPRPQRVDPHLVGLAIKDLLALNRLSRHHHPSTNVSWYSNPGTKRDQYQPRIDELAPLYASISGDGFGNLTGDALELIVWRCLEGKYSADRRYAYQGHFDLTQPKNEQGRYRKVQPAKNLNGSTSKREADFFQFGFTSGPLCIECKNYREWLYPHHQNIRDLIIKSSEFKAVPVLIHRRIHYTTMRNLLEPAGIIAHESLFQYYPADQAELAAKVKHARSLGFTDVTASEEPHKRTVRFFSEIVPKVVDQMAERWYANEPALLAYAQEEINLAQLYNELGSPAAGNWVDK